MNLLDSLAHRLLARSFAYTPEVHYSMRQKLLVGSPDLMRHSRLRFPYWMAMFFARCSDLYWSVRGSVGK